MAYFNVDLHMFQLCIKFDQKNAKTAKIRENKIRQKSVNKMHFLFRLLLSKVRKKLLFIHALIRDFFFSRIFHVYKFGKTKLRPLFPNMAVVFQYLVSIKSYGEKRPPSYKTSC